MDGIFDFLLRLLPSPRDFSVAAVVSAAAILTGGILSGVLKHRARWPTGYTRKLFHFLIFFTAVGLHLWRGMPAVNILGLGMGIYVALVVRAGDGNFFFEALAREKDAPRRGYFIVLPYLTTAAGGILSNCLFGSCAVMGYLICGAADAVAEPIGVRSGWRRYRVPSVKKVEAAERTVEGSVSMLLASVILAAAFFSAHFHLPLSVSFLSSLLLSAAVVVVEAFSPHGADNLTIQVTASGLAALFIRLWG